MENTRENKFFEETASDLPVQAENIAYDFDEMIECGRCKRASPPNRLKCLYCGAQLEFSDAQSGLVKPVLRKLEAWEKGFNLIYLPDETTAVEDHHTKEIGRMTRIETETLQKIFEARKPLPLARAETEKEAEIVRQRFDENGIKTVILSDEKLAAENSPVRLRGMGIVGDTIYLVAFNTDDVFQMKSDDLMLIVTGAVFQKRVESKEKRSKKGENTLLSATETATDEKLFDIYFRNDETGFRIAQKGFDFSCLDDKKGMFAAENIERLVKKLKSFAPDAKLVEDYLPNRASVVNVWDVTERKDSKGLVRETFGKFNISNATIVSNLEQFTKYSRMQRNLL